MRPNVPKVRPAEDLESDTILFREKGGIDNFVHLHLLITPTMWGIIMEVAKNSRAVHIHLEGWLP